MSSLRTIFDVRQRADVAAVFLVVAALQCATERTKNAGDGFSGEATMRLDETANDSEVRLTVAKTFEIVLAETRTTGHRWKVESDGTPVCRLERDRFEAPPATPGAPGRHSWTFTAVQAGAATIELAYARSFGNAEAARRFTLRVLVQ